MTTFDSSILLDHMVINARFQMDEAAALFEALGFTLTPRGHHTLGSINNLMMYRSDYLELLGLPPGDGDRRPELVNSPLCINGLVFKTEDVDATYAHMRALDMDGDPPKSFSRPVDIGGESRDASFRTVTVRDGVFGGGRVYFCQHLTPELLWRSEWQSHPNSVESTRQFVVVAPEPAAEAARYGALLGREPSPLEDGVATIGLGDAALAVLGQDAYVQRFGDLALPCPADSAIFGALSFRCGSREALEAALDGTHPGCRMRRAGDAVQVAVDTFGTVLEFHA